MCEALQQSGNIKRLAAFLWTLPCHDNSLMNNESVLKARAEVCFNEGNYAEVYRILSVSNLGERDCSVFKMGERERERDCSVFQMGEREREGEGL